MVFGFGHVPGSAGFGRSVSVCPLSSSGIGAALSIATISAPPCYNTCCNSAGAPVGDENAARILSTGNAVVVVGGALASADPLDFRDGL